MSTDDAADAETDKTSSNPSNNTLGPGSPSSSVFPRGVRQLLVMKEDVSSEWSSSLDQEDPEPLHIKEEQEERWTSQEGEQLNELEEADITRFPFTAVTVKSEDDEEKLQTSLLHQSQTEDNRQAEPPASSSATQMKTEIDGEDSGGSEPARNQDAGVQLLFVIKEEVPPEWSPSQDQEDVEPLHIKEEQEELWTGQEGEQFNRLKEDVITMLPFTAVTVKSEDDEEKPQTSQLHQSQTEDNREAEPPASSSATQIKTESDEEDCGGSEPARNREPDSHPQPNTDEKASDCSETDVSSGDWQEPLLDSGPETEDSDSGCEETRAPESEVNDLKYKEGPVSDVGCNAGKKTLSCFDCGQGFHCKGSLKKHMRCHIRKRSSSHLVKQKYCRLKEKEDAQIRVKTGEKTFDCSDCGTRFSLKRNLERHMQVHSGEKPFACDICGKRCIRQGALKTHMRVHTGEKPFGCDVCGKRFTQQGNLKTHMRVHTGEKPVGCDVCGKRFTQQGYLNTHMKVHTGEKPFVCDYCGTRFSLKSNFERHVRVHTGEKPFGCDVCGKRFTHHGSLKAHMRGHTGEKPYGCETCGRRFTHQASLKVHLTVHIGGKSFGCGVCSKRFKQQGSLKSHMKVHSE